MTFSFSKSLAAAAATGLLAAACGGTNPGAQSADDAASGEKEGCKGEESCEAKSDCKAKDGCNGHSPE